MFPSGEASVLDPVKRSPIFLLVGKHADSVDDGDQRLPVPMFETKFDVAMMSMMEGYQAFPLRLLEAKMRPLFAGQVCRPLSNSLTPAWLLPENFVGEGFDYVQWRLCSLSLGLATVPDEKTMWEHMGMKRQNVERYGVARLVCRKVVGF